MKKTFLITLFLTSFSYSQTLKGIITVNPKQGVGNETELSVKAKKPMYHSYIFSNNISIQELISEERTSIDTIIVEHPEVKGLTKETTKALIKSNKIIIFKDYTSNLIRFETSRKNRYLVTENTSIEDEIPVYNWILVEKEKQTIAGYLCKKATTERILFGRKQHITAWYCDEIPISDGPSNFNGLPGLILQIEIDKNNIIKFEKIKFFKDKNTVITPPKNESELITIKQFELQVLNGKY